MTSLPLMACFSWQRPVPTLFAAAWHSRVWHLASEKSVGCTSTAASADLDWVGG